MTDTRTSGIATVALLLFLSGCAHNYVTPGGGVPLTSIDDTSIEAAFTRVAASPFPARVAVVRVQDSGYVTQTNHGHQYGRYSVVTTRDIEPDDAFTDIAALPLIGGVAPLSRLLIPANANNIRDLRQPAAQLKADMLLIYSVDTSFTVDGRSLGPLSTISLGLIPNKTAHVTATVAGILVDVRTGFIYGATEATSIEHQRTTVWATRLATDAARLRAERNAFEDFIGEFERLWSGVLNVHAARRAPTPLIDHTPARDADGWYRVEY